MLAGVHRRARGCARICAHGLQRAPDIERALSRLLVGRGGPARSGGARAIGSPRPGRCASVSPTSSRSARGAAPGGGSARRAWRARSRSSAARLGPELPLIARDGGFIAPGYRDGLDELRSLRDESRRLVLELEARYRGETGIASLKIRHNNVLGYYVEIDGDPSREADRHRRASSIARPWPMPTRFTTVELGELEQPHRQRRRQGAGPGARTASPSWWRWRAPQPRRSLASAAALAAARCRRGLAELAVEGDYCRPLVDESTAFEIKAGRHPVVEAALRAQQAGGFVANDCDLGDGAAALAGDRPQHGGQIDLPAPERADRRAGPDGRLRARAGRPYRHRRPAVQPRRRGRRSRPRPLDLHGGDGGDGGDPEPGEPALPRHPRRDRPRHGDLRRALHRLGDDRASA